MYLLVRISPICLPLTEPLRSKDLSGSNPYVAGWWSPDSVDRSTLRQAQLPLIDNAECMASYADLGHFAEFDSTVMCGGGEDEICVGGAAGPLMLPQPFQSHNIFYQIGVFNYGTRSQCANRKAPAVYTNVRDFIDWIQKETVV